MTRSETPLDHWLDMLDQCGGCAAVPLCENHEAELRKLVRTAQREAAERGFWAGFTAAYNVDAPERAREGLTASYWAASALHADLEDPT